MVKTNFKCMYLVDDMLYKKMSNSETGMNVNQNMSSTHIPNIFLEKNNYLTDKHFEKQGSLHPEQYTSSDRVDHEDKTTQTKEPVPDTSSDRVDYEDKITQTKEHIPDDELKEKSLLSNPDQTELHTVNMDTTDNNDPACKCNGIEDQPEGKKTQAVKRRHPLSADRDDKKKMKISSNNVSDNDIKKTDEYEPINDPEMKTEGTIS